MNRVAITRVSLREKSNKKHLAYIVLDEKREFVDFQVFEESESYLNRIYVARVDNIVSNIHGAFVRISPKKVCYLPLEDLVSPIYVKKQSALKPLSIGDEIVVQVVKDAVKTKEPVVSTKLTLLGNYCVLTTDNTSLGVSKKITGELHSQMSALLEECVAESAQIHEFGMVIRTNAKEASVEQLKKDLEDTMNRFIDLRKKSVHQCAFAALEQPEAPYIQKLKSEDLSSLDKIYTDDEDIFQEIDKKLSYLREKKYLELYTDTQVSLGTLYNFKGSVERLVEKRVWLKSGANIIVEQLETMTVIDVNSGKNMSKGQKAILDMNKEAAVEIVKQARLRNLSGMIIVDFINMKSKDYMDELVALLKEEMKKDAVTFSFVDVTKLGLVELTRKKTYKSLKEVIE